MARRESSSTDIVSYDIAFGLHKSPGSREDDRWIVYSKPTGFITSRLITILPRLHFTPQDHPMPVGNTDIYPPDYYYTTRGAVSGFIPNTIVDRRDWWNFSMLIITPPITSELNDKSMEVFSRWQGILKISNRY